MAALEEFELGIDHIRNAFKRADNGFANAYKMLEAERQKNHKLEAENTKLRELIGTYHEYCLCNQHSEKSAHQLITEIENMICELGIEV